MTAWTILWLAVASAVLVLGIIGRIVKRGKEHNYKNMVRVASLGLMYSAPVVALFAVSAFDWHYRLWALTSLWLFCVAVWMARNVPAIEEDPVFEKKSYDEIAKMSKDDKIVYKTARKEHRKLVLARTWAKMPAAIVFMAALCALIIFFVRLGFDLNINDPYSPTAWWPWIVVLIVAAAGVLCQYPLHLKRWWITIPLGLVACGILIWLALMPARSNFVVAADEAYTSAAEMVEEQKPDVDTESAKYSCTTEEMLGGDGLVAHIDTPLEVTLATDIEALFYVLTQTGLADGFEKPIDLVNESGNCLNDTAAERYNQLFEKIELGELTLEEVEIFRQDYCLIAGCPTE